VRIGILSDIHANLPALEVVLDHMSRQHLEAMFCLGDLVGYGAFPNEVTALIKSSGIPTIMGNYDDGVGFDRDECGCAYRDPAEEERGHRSLLWTRARTTDENKAFLRSLLPNIRRDVAGKRLLLVHGSPRRMNEYLFEDRPLSSFQRLAASSAADAIVFGHTHRPYAKLVSDVWFVNAGSVGKPKDGDWRACYAILDPGADPPVEFVRLEYDLERAIDAIRATDLPGEFADDLRQNRAGVSGRAP
jgi:putative phosphoesterase